MTAENQIKLLLEEVERLRKELESKNSVIDVKDKKISSLESELSWLRKKIFGKMSEKNLPIDPNALTIPGLFDDELTDQEKEKLAEEVEKENQEKSRLIKVESFERRVRKPIDTNNLEVVEEHIYPENINTEEYVELDTETTDSLVLVPARLYIKRIVRHKFVLKSNLQIESPERQTFVIAPLPPAPIHKCMASASVLTDIVMYKFLYHMPFYRVIQKYKEMGVTISSSTINDWFTATCQKLELIYNSLKTDVMNTDYIQVDESTLPVIDNEKRRAVKGYIWVARSVMNKSVVFHYDMGSRSHDTARKLLFNYKVIIQTDGYGAYDQFEKNADIMILGCWAHARRKFSDALEEDNKKASEALVYINKLYRIENEAKEENLDCDQLKERRQIEAYPGILEFVLWMLNTHTRVLSTSRIGKAISYTYALLPRLSRYVNDGRFCMDNNLIENSIRPLAIGRKNFLFCGNHEAAVRAAIVYSLIGTCKALDVDPKEWMEDILNRMPEYETGKKDISELLPYNWKSSKKN